MKKNYILILTFFLSTGLMAQVANLAVVFNGFDGDVSTSDDPLDVSFTIQNKGAAIGPDTTVWVKYTDGNSPTATGWSPTSLDKDKIAKLTLGIPMNGNFNSNLITEFSPILTMDEMYNSFGKKKEIRFCVFVGLGGRSTIEDPNYDSDYSDNYACLTYNVTAVTGIEDESLSQIVVYPNPATNQVNFNLGNVQVDAINVMDISGRIIDRVVVNNSTPKLSVDTYENGIYFYQIVQGSEVVTSDKFTVFN